MCGTRFVQHPAATVPPALIGCCTDIDVADESGGTTERGGQLLAIEV